MNPTPIKNLEINKINYEYPPQLEKFLKEKYQLKENNSFAGSPKSIVINKSPVKHEVVNTVETVETSDRNQVVNNNLSNRSFNKEIDDLVKKCISRSEDALKNLKIIQKEQHETSQYPQSMMGSFLLSPQNVSTIQPTTNIQPNIFLNQTVNNLTKFEKNRQIPHMNQYSKKYTTNSNKLKIDEMFEKAMKRSHAVLNMHQSTSMIAGRLSTKNVKSSKKDEIDISNVYERISNYKENSSSNVKKTTQNPQSNKKISNFQAKVNDYAEYEGDLKGEQRHGHGKCVYKNGDIYEGEFKYDRRDGYGTIKNSSGQELYSGDWEDDVYHGQGILTNPNPEKIESSFDYNDFNNLNLCWDRYEGEFLKGQRSGLGTLYLANSEKITGKLLEDKLNGEATFYSLDGSRTIGKWEKNKLVKIL